MKFQLKKLQVESGFFFIPLLIFDLFSQIKDSFQEVSTFKEEIQH